MTPGLAFNELPEKTKRPRRSKRTRGSRSWWRNQTKKSWIWSWPHMPADADFAIFQTFCRKGWTNVCSTNFKVYYKWNPNRSHQFRGLLRNLNTKKQSFFPATAIYGSLDSFRTTRLPCATKGQATNYDDADGSSCQHDLGQVNDFFTGQINEFLKWIQGPRRVLRLEDFPDFKRIVGDF